MSEFKGDTAESAPERPEKKEITLTLATARNMVPLVRRIIDDILQAEQSLALLQPEEDRLYQVRKDLTWPERCRRYEIKEELVVEERKLKTALAEIDGLGLTITDPEAGRVGFPTIVNGRRAYFSWQPDEQTIRHWQFVGETLLRTIPGIWEEPVESRESRKR